MSSWKKAAKSSQKTHRERHQPEFHKNKGKLLEKKKDYVARARDYNEKKATLKLLRKRALNRNPDEFYFHMINSQVENGIHREKEPEEEEDEEQIKLMETQDMKYIVHKRNAEAKKVERLQSRLHLIDVANEIPNKHVFFDSDGKEVKSVDLAKRLNTHPDLVWRRTNRPRLDQLKNMELPDVDEVTLAKINQQKNMAYKELSKRIDREHKLSVTQEKLEIKRHLKDKKVAKPQKVVAGSIDRAPVYKWKFERKK